MKHVFLIVLFTLPCAALCYAQNVRMTAWVQAFPGNDPDSNMYQYSGTRGTVWPTVYGDFANSVDTNREYMDSAGIPIVRYLNTYAYDVMGNQTHHAYFYHDTGGLVFGDVDSTFYNAIGNPTLVCSLYAENPYLNAIDSIKYTYNSNNQLLLKDEKKYALTSPTPEEGGGTRTIIHYNAANLPDSNSVFNDAGSGQYQAISLDVHHYDAAGRDTLWDNYQRFDIGTMGTFYTTELYLRTRKHMHYGGAGNMDIQITEVYPSSVGSGQNDPTVLFQTIYDYYTYNSLALYTTDSAVTKNDSNTLVSVVTLNYNYTGSRLDSFVEKGYQIVSGLPAGSPFNGYGIRYQYGNYNFPDKKIVEYQFGDPSSLAVEYRYYYELTPTAITAPATALSGIRVWPQPAGSNLQIDLDANAAKTATLIQLFDINGRLLMATPPTGIHTSLPIASLPVGSYVLCVGGNGSSYRQMVQKQ